MKKPHLVIITGLSGAGKSQALHALEDLDFFCVDNLPPAMLMEFVLLLRETAERQQDIAVCIDVRAGSFFIELRNALVLLKEEGFTPEILFLDATDAALLRRYKETRRPHPLAPNGRVQDGIALERQQLEPLHLLATRTLDTSTMNPNQLRARVRSDYLPAQQGTGLQVNVVSFGFRYGLPDDADLVFDVRFLPNPHWVEDLRPLTGLDNPVYDYIMEREEANQFFSYLQEMLSFLLPLYLHEGKSQLVIAIGCTGGRHRSVAIAARLADYLSAQSIKVQLGHRDLETLELEETNR